MRLLLKLSIFFLIFSLLFTCDKVDEKYKPNVTLNITIKDDSGILVNGLGANTNIFIFNNGADYLDAFINKSSTRGITLNNFKSAGNGVYEFMLDNPNQNYWIFVTNKDGSRSFNLSNFGISGPLKKLPSRAIVYLELIIRPDDGNLVFYSTATNNMPIEVKLGEFDTTYIGNIDTKIINSSFTGSGMPSLLQDNISSVWFNKNPGKYSYYAKSNDGCVWTGIVNLEKGKTIPIDLSKCPNGKISFYTTTINSALLPLSVTINGQNLAPKEVSTLNSVTAITSFNCTASSSPELLTFTRSAGLYNYFISTADGKCVWTGTLNLATDECKFIKLDQCDLP